MFLRTATTAICILLVPRLALAQDLPGEIRSLHDILDSLFEKMLPLCDELTDVSRVVAGFGAVFYIAYRVWKHIANAEPIDFFPLFRPFVLAFCISIFPSIIMLINGVLYPTEVGTRAMVDDSNDAVARLLAKREEEMKKTRSYKMYGVNEGAGDRDVWMEMTHPEEIGDEDWWGLGNDVEFAMDKAFYGLKNWFKDLLSFLLQLLYEAAALCINTIRTFNLLICALLGPFVFALSVFDGMQHSLTVWLARYVNYYLWLPIANILGAMLGKIQEEMIALDLKDMEQFGDEFFTTTDVGYLVFMIIGIVAYMTVPSLSNLIVNTGGGGASMLTSRVSNMAMSPTKAVVGGAMGSTAMGGMGADAYGDEHLRMTRGTGGSIDSGYFSDKLKG